MPYLVNTGYYPSETVDEMAKAYFEMLEKFPIDESFGELVMMGPRRTEKGIKFMGITKVKKGKLEDLIDYVDKQMSLFRNIKGFESTTEIWQTIEEGMASAGIQPPSE